MNDEVSNDCHQVVNGDGESPPVGSNGVHPTALLPRYLSPLVWHHRGEFYISRSFDPQLIMQLMAEGFLPIATRGYLLPKLHLERCVVRLGPASNLHVSRSTRKKLRAFLISVNECFNEVVAGCHRQQ
jgi:Leu/Phe-tRNA-protein transferase